MIEVQIITWKEGASLWIGKKCFASAKAGLLVGLSKGSKSASFARAKQSLTNGSTLIHWFTNDIHDAAQSFSTHWNLQSKSSTPANLSLSPVQI